MERFHLEKLLGNAVRENASDLHLKIGSVPIMRVEGNLIPLETQVLNKELMGGVIKSALRETQQVYFDKHKNLDFSLEIDINGDKQRFRVNAGADNDGPYLTFRVIQSKIREVSTLGFPYDVWTDITDLQEGLVLVTGITGSGKTTTLASMIERINMTRGDRIVTIEDPIEYVYTPKKSLISQRELGVNVSSFAEGVKYSLRQDPDIILIGEIRDKETAKHALEASQTGHLVFSTLHTGSAAETTRRYIDLFPPEEQTHVREALAANLAYVLSQKLIPYQKGKGRTLAMEVMNARVSAIKNNIREGKYQYLFNTIQTHSKFKMITMDQHLVQLNQAGKISDADRIKYSPGIEPSK